MVGVNAAEHGKTSRGEHYLGMIVLCVGIMSAKHMVETVFRDECSQPWQGNKPE